MLFGALWFGFVLLFGLCFGGVLCCGCSCEAGDLLHLEVLCFLVVDVEATMVFVVAESYLSVDLVGLSEMSGVAFRL